MTVLSTKELYGLFLDSEWWRRLTREKKRSVGNRCELCGGVAALQSHHVFYRPNWFDTQMEDLLVLCRKCHKKTHGIDGEDEVIDLNVEPPKVEPVRMSLHDLNQLRAKRKITRLEFKRLRSELLGIPLPSKPLFKKSKPKWRKRSKRKRRGRSPCKPWHYVGGRRHRWVNRGNSSN